MAMGDSISTSLGYGYNNSPYFNYPDQILKPGAKIYVIAYGLGGPYYYTGIYSEGYYFDPELNKEVFPSIAPTSSETVGIALP